MGTLGFNPDATLWHDCEIKFLGRSKVVLDPETVHRAVGHCKYKSLEWKGGGGGEQVEEVMEGQGSAKAMRQWKGRRRVGRCKEKPESPQRFYTIRKAAGRF